MSTALIAAGTWARIAEGKIANIFVITAETDMAGAEWERRVNISRTRTYASIAGGRGMRERRHRGIVSGMGLLGTMGVVR